MLELIGCQKQVRCLIADFVGFGLCAHLGTTRNLSSGSQLVTFRAVEQSHFRLDLEEAWRVSVDAVRIAVGIGQTASSEDLRPERVLSYPDSLFCPLLFEPSQGNIGILACGRTDYFRQSERVNFAQQRSDEKKVS